MTDQNHRLNAMRQSVLKAITNHCKCKQENVHAESVFDYKNKILGIVFFEATLGYLELGSKLNNPPTPNITEFRLDQVKVYPLFGQRGKTLPNITRELNRLLAENINQTLN